MKIIQGMKKVQDDLRKVDDLQGKVAKYCADLDFENPTYGTGEQQRAQVKEWLQSIHDTLKNVEHLRESISRTNLMTKVKIEIGGVQIEKTLTAWIMRRGVKNDGLAGREMKSWAALTDKALKDGSAKMTSGETVAVKVRRYFDPAERDKKVEVYRSEPSLIDATLEVINAVTELIEA